MSGDKRPGSSISLVQVLASALAAVTSTVALSYLGVTGTIVGAALASVITVVGNFIYARSLDKTHRAVKNLAQQAATVVLPAAQTRPDDAAEAAPASEQDSVGSATSDAGEAASGEAKADLGDRDTVPASSSSEVTSQASQAGDGPALESAVAVDGPTTADGAEGGEGSQAEDKAGEGRLAELPVAKPVAVGPSIHDEAWFSRMTERYGTTKTLVALGLAVFLLIMGLITALELWMGRPLSDELTGRTSGRETTFLNRPAPAQTPPGHQTPPPATPTMTPTPSPTPTPTPTPTPSETPPPT
ncbi:MAG: hypothetical protein LBH68_06405, partial [Bifidobacteriaceae bacterium]|nr:hypothetical protein [Bifidobacteriaceae bacterium]